MEDKNKILVLGGGHQGLAMAAHLVLRGEKINLWNRTASNIIDIIETKDIYCNGIINGVAHIDAVSADIDEVLTETIMVTTPAYAHKELAALLAPRVTDNTVIILNPGRTFGAWEFAHALNENGCKSNPKIAETQTILYTCRRSDKNHVTIYALKNTVMIAALNANDLEEIRQRIPSSIRDYFTAAKSIIQTSLGNVGMILHCAPMLMNVGWIENEEAEFKYYYDGISEAVAGFLEKIDAERLKVAEAMGAGVESVSDWMRNAYDVKGANLYECIRNNTCYKDIGAPQVIRHRYLEEDVPYGLVPLESVGSYLGIPTPNTKLIIDLANAVLERDYRASGRHFRAYKN